MSRPLLKFGGGSGEILRDLLHLRSVSEAEALISGAEGRVLAPVAVDREIEGETTGLAAPLHLSDERDRRDSVRQARV